MTRFGTLGLFGCIAGAGLGMTSPARAEAEIWNGVLAMSSTMQCEPVGRLDGTAGAIYRPHLTVNDPNASLMIISGDAQGHFLEFQALTTTATMEGTGSYKGSFFEAHTGTKTWSGTYTLNVTPDNVMANTTFVQITGTIKKFANVTGCNVSIKGAFLRQLPSD